MLADISNILTFAVMGILFLFGVIVTVMARREHGSAAMIGMSGCILLLLGLAFDGFRSFVLYPQLGASIGVEAVTVTNLVSLLFNAGGTALLIWAVVARRKPQPAQPQPAQPQGPVQPQQGPGWPQQGPGWPQQPPYPQQPYPQQPQPGWQNPQQPPYGHGQS
ncbi:hypothetical protein ACFPOI_57155 [Nonomuraea angiospora]|uniref:Na+/proline symporter n=1 Tax=Nonomuraea angiospora TaxID=46172 RepID=A0ABR9M035_9ACTN|nr:hypothetical protein [Nonomuraea angiospora]MBE1586266.1 Na+/proline symporter [Nonomuraea angiospora]